MAMSHPRPGFEHVETWIFDLDNTLYPPACDLFAQVDQRMGEFIARLLGVDRSAARLVQKQYYRDYGTTLRGLMSEHHINPADFLDYVHDIDLSPVAPDAALAAAIDALPGHKYIFTNGSRPYAEKVAGALASCTFSTTFSTLPQAASFPSRTRPAMRAFWRM